MAGRSAQAQRASVRDELVLLLCALLIIQMLICALSRISHMDPYGQRRPRYFSVDYQKMKAQEDKRNEQYNRVKEQVFSSASFSIVSISVMRASTAWTMLT